MKTGCNFEYGSDLNIARKLIQIKDNADKRNIKFNLSFSKLKREMQRKRCYFTGRTFENIREGGKPQNILTIDRIDNDKGYVDSNIVACTSSVNSLKGDLTIEELKMLTSKI